MKEDKIEKREIKEEEIEESKTPEFTPEEEREEIKPEMEEEIEKPEFIPTPEDIKFVFEELLKVENYETIRQLEDEQGLYLWDIKISEEDGYIEYSYTRKGIYPEVRASDIAIHLTFFNKEDFPISGYSVAKYIDGEWKLTP